ncbi:MAG: AmmeMemoRadiSam system protein A, partial [Patescibacteria group bacterium]
MLNKLEQKVALKLARQTLENYFDSSENIDEEYKNFDVFNKKCGVFVTLNKNDQLRGCIGLIEPPEISLSEAISQMALSVAFNDTRFSKLDKNELKNIKIEISVLTVPQRSNVNDIELSRHGVMIKNGFNSGVFLPQVATETG